MRQPYITLHIVGFYNQTLTIIKLLTQKTFKYSPTMLLIQQNLPSLSPIPASSHNEDRRGHKKLSMFSKYFYDEDLVLKCVFGHPWLTLLSPVSPQSELPGSVTDQPGLARQLFLSFSCSSKHFQTSAPHKLSIDFRHNNRKVFFLNWTIYSIYPIYPTLYLK